VQDRILITGASGYLGGFVVNALAGTAPLRLFDRVAPESVPADAELVLGDVVDLAAIEGAVRGCRAVVHMVALVRGRSSRPLADFANVMFRGTWNVFDAAARYGVPRVVNVSSIVAGRFAGDRRNTIHDPPEYGQGDLPYALSKTVAEEVGRAYHRAYGLAVVHVRPGIIAGDGANPGPKKPEGRAGLWFLYVDPRDVAGAVALAVRDDAPEYGTFPVVADRADTTIDLTPTIEQLGFRPQHNWPGIPEADAHESHE